MTQDVTDKVLSGEIVTARTVTRGHGDKIKHNARKLTTIITAIIQQATSSGSIFESIDLKENGTRKTVEKFAHF